MTEQMSMSVPAEAGQWKTSHLMAALRASFGADEDAAKVTGAQGSPELFVEEVTAPGTNRRCDLLRIGLWNSRGAGAITVYELKVSRSDWLRELAEPAKAEAWWEFCHEFYIVAPPGVVKPEELPAGWGLMTPPRGRSRRFVVEQRAARHEAKVTPLLVAAIVARADNMRRAQIGALNDGIEARLRKVRQEERRRAALDEVPRSVRDRLELLDRLEETAGFKLDDFVLLDPPSPDAPEVTPDEAGAALRDFVYDHVSVRRAEARMRKQAQRLVPHLERALEQCRRIGDGGDA